MTDTQQWVAMGHVKGVFGIKGWLKIAADTEYTDSLLDYPQWQLRKDGHILTVTVEDAKVAGDELQVKFEGINNRDHAFLLRGYTVEIARSEFAPTEENEFYWADLVGMTVINREGLTLGTVKNLLETGANDVLVVHGEYGQKLIPFVSQYVGHVDAGKQTITVDWDLDY